MSDITIERLNDIIAHNGLILDLDPFVSPAELVSLATELLEHRSSIPQQTREGEDGYVPCLIRNNEARFIEFVERDVPAVTGEMMALNVEPIYDLATRVLIGYRIYDDALFSASPTSIISGGTE